MQKGAIIAAAVAILLGCCWLHAERAVQVISGKVMAIADGDTLTVLDASNNQHKIRLEGIDAPERWQDFGTQCRDALASAVFGKVVAVKWREKDRYGRIFGQVHWGDEWIKRDMDSSHRGYCRLRHAFHLP